MKKTLLFLFMVFALISNAQESDRFSSMDFVLVLNDHKAETRYYYENNWKALREEALELGFIHSYQLLETSASEDAPFDFILITTYANSTQYDNREANFQKLIKAAGGLKLLNTLQPKDFRKTIFGKDFVKHLD